MRLYVHMVMCGSVCTLLYIFFNNILPYELPLKWKRILVRINIGFYLLPVPWMAAEMKELLRWLLEKAGMFFDQSKSTDVYDATSVWNSFIVLNEDGKIIYITGYQEIFPIAMVILTVCFALIAGWALLYIRASIQYKRNMVFFDADHYLKDKHTKRKIVIGVSPCVSSPVTVGLIKPVILLPVDYREYENAMESVILHELNHVSCRDVVERFFGFVVVVVHFFNPLVHYLFREIVAVSEMLCDEAAVKGRTKKQKADYIRCIMEASQKTGNSRIIAPSLGVSKSLLRKRMEKIMGINKKKVWRKRAAVIVVTACVLVCSILALNYRKPWTYMQSGESVWNDGDLLVFAQTGEENPMEGMHLDFSQGAAVFVGEDGSVDSDITNYGIRQEHQGQKQSVCAHSFTSGTIAEHIGHDDGSCTVVMYQAQKCTKCGNVVRGDEVSTSAYKSCTHIDAGDAEPGEIVTLAVVNTDALKMRSVAEKDAEVIALLMEGKVVRIIAEENDFYKIIIQSEEDGELLEGYVRKEYLGSPASDMGIVNMNALRMRSEAEKDAKVIALLKEGEVVQIIAEEDDFFKIIIQSEEDGEFMEGYVRKEFLNLLLKDSGVSIMAG